MTGRSASKGRPHRSSQRPALRTVNGTATTATFNAANQLTAGGAVNYTYDGAGQPGQRVSRFAAGQRPSHAAANRSSAEARARSTTST
jgi:hypothetical protein